MFLVDVPPRKRFRLGLRAFLILAGIAGALAASILVEENHYVWALLATLLVSVAALAEFVLADVVTERLYPASTATILEKLESNLRTYHDRIVESIGKAIDSLASCDKTKVSGTVHLKVDLYSQSGGELEPGLVQITEYSGALGGNRWRFTSASKGLVGRCLRTQRRERVNFATESEYTERMVREFGFLPVEVEKHTKEARSYLAEPIFVKHRLIGVMFLFSTETEVFPEAAETVRIEGAAAEVAAYLEGAGIV